MIKGPIFILLFSAVSILNLCTILWGQVWEPSSPAVNGPIHSSYYFNGNFYIGGRFGLDKPGLVNLAYISGNEPIPVEYVDQFSTQRGAIEPLAFATDGNRLYFLASTRIDQNFKSAIFVLNESGKAELYMDSLPIGYISTAGAFNSGFLFYDGKPVIYGNDQNPDKEKLFIHQNGKWSNILPSDIEGKLNAIGVFESKIIMGGTLKSQTENIEYLVSWNEAGFSDVGLGFRAETEVHSIANFKDTLFVSFAPDTNLHPKVYRIIDGIWVLTIFQDNLQFSGTRLLNGSGNLYISSYRSGQSLARIYRYENIQWNLALDSIDGTPLAIHDDKACIIVGGKIDSIGAVKTRSLAMLNCNTTSLNSFPDKPNIYYHDRKLYVGESILVGNDQVVVSDLLGKELRSFKIDAQMSNAISLSWLPPGQYLARHYSGSHPGHLRFIVED